MVIWVTYDVVCSTSECDKKEKTDAVRRLVIMDLHSNTSGSRSLAMSRGEFPALIAYPIEFNWIESLYLKLVRNITIK